MPTVHHSSVIVPPNRQRQTFKEEDIHDLAEDMCRPWGQLKPIVLRDDGVTLVAGERRLRAAAYAESKGWKIRYGRDGDFQTLDGGFLVARSIGSLSPEELEEAELSENIKRVDLTWQELVAARSRLATLRRVQNPKVSNEEIAKELSPSGVAPSSTRLVNNAELLAANLHRPEVAKAKSAGEGMKVLSRQLEQEFRSELAKRQEGIPLDSRHTLIHGDLLSEMAKLASSSVDCLLTDPPYGINADTAFGDMAELDHEYADSEKDADAIYQVLAYQGYRICKSQAHAYVFLDMDWWEVVASYFRSAGWWVWPRPLIWDKAGGMLPHPHHGPRNTYELILYAIKGKRQTNGVFPDIIRVPNVKTKSHAAQKPVELYSNLLERTVAPGDIVLDPCAGSGTIFPAATRVSAQAIGIEKSEKHYALALSRIKEQDVSSGGSDTPTANFEDL